MSVIDVIKYRVWQQEMGIIPLFALRTNSRRRNIQMRNGLAINGAGGLLVEAARFRGKALSQQGGERALRGERIAWPGGYDNVALLQ